MLTAERWVLPRDELRELVREHGLAARRVRRSVEQAPAGREEHRVRVPRRGTVEERVARRVGHARIVRGVEREGAREDVLGYRGGVDEEREDVLRECGVLERWRRAKVP